MRFLFGTRYDFDVTEVYNNKKIKEALEDSLIEKGLLFAGTLVDENADRSMIELHYTIEDGCTVVNVYFNKEGE